MISTEGKIVIKPSVFGKGLFASEFVPENTIVCKVTGTYLTFAETILLGEKESYCLQIGTDKYIYCSEPFLYSNHSCNPNCAINSDLDFYTLKNIEKGEELLWDYSTSMLERHWTMKCSCGSKNCRRIITDFDLLPQAIQQSYLQMNIVLPFIVQNYEQKFAISA